MNLSLALLRGKSRHWLIKPPSKNYNHPSHETEPTTILGKYQSEQQGMW